MLALQPCARHQLPTACASGISGSRVTSERVRLLTETPARGGGGKAGAWAGARAWRGGGGWSRGRQRAGRAWRHVRVGQQRASQRAGARRAHSRGRCEGAGGARAVCAPHTRVQTRLPEHRRGGRGERACPAAAAAAALPGPPLLPTVVVPDLAGGDQQHVPLLPLQPRAHLGGVGPPEGHHHRLGRLVHQRHVALVQLRAVGLQRTARARGACVRGVDAGWGGREQGLVCGPRSQVPGPRAGVPLSASCSHHTRGTP
jgi:hypothetical protein